MDNKVRIMDKREDMNRSFDQRKRYLNIAFTCLLSAVMLMSGLAGVFADSTNNAQDTFSDTVITRGNFQYNVSGVHQSTSTDSVSTFGSAMPLSTIYIDMNYLKPEQGIFAKLASNNNTHQAAFADGIKTVQVEENKTYAVYDPKDQQLQLKAGQDNYLAGNLFSYTFPNAAVLSDGSRASVKITYSNAHIFVDQRLGSTGADSSLKGPVHLAYGNSVQYGHEDDSTSYSTYNNAVRGSSDHPVTVWSGTSRAVVGLSIDARIQVVDDKGNPINGTFIFPTVGLNIDRDPDSGFSYAKPLWYFEDNYPEYDFFSEALRVNSGNKADFYVRPNSSIEETASGNDNKNKYQPMVTEVLAGAYQGAVKFTADTNSRQSQANNNCYVSGFITTADAASGMNVTTNGHGTTIGNNGTMNTSLMSGSQIWHRIRSVTGPGGNIQTTTEANFGGTLDDGGEVLGQGTYVVPDGKTVVYTMKPDKGYVLDKLRINDSITSVPTVIDGVAEMKPGDTKQVTLAENMTGTITKKNDGSYTFDFPYNNYDHSIMVTWVPESVKLSATKRWYDRNNSFGTRKNIVVHINGAANYESGESHNYPKDFLPSQNYNAGTVDDGNDDWTAVWGDGTANTHYSETVYSTVDNLPVTVGDKAAYYFYDYSKRQFRAYTYNSVTGEFEATDVYYWVNMLPKYDESGKKITYTVEEDVPDGYSLTVTSKDSEDYDFAYNLINSLEPVATVKIPVQKALDGRAFGSSEDYIFVLSGEDGTPMPVKTTVKIPGQGEDDPAEVVATTTSNASGKINEVRKTADFGVISYRKSDLKEKKVTYGEASAEERSRVRFWTLTYTDTEAGKKITRTFDMNDAADKALFESLPGAGVSADGAEGSLYSAVFKYKVTENPKHGPLVENDTKIKEFTVDVVYDELKGRFYVGGEDATADSTSDLNAEKITLKPVYFENEYDNAAEYSPEIIKNLSGRPISADQFKGSFTIKAVDTEEGYGVNTKLTADKTPMPGGKYGGTAISSTRKIKTTNAGAGGTNDVQAVIGFDKPIIYTNDDLKKEIKKTEKGSNKVIEWTSGDTVYGPIPDDAVNSESITVNGQTYEAGSVKYSEANESLRQASKGDTADSLWTYNGKKRVDDISLAPDSATGFYYMSERTFTYKVWESSSAAAGYTNDTHDSEDEAIKLKVKVTRDDDTGKITVSDVSEDALEFTNKYEANGDVIIKAVKNIKGRNLTGGEFEFEIEAVTEGAPLPAVKKVSNKADGTIGFDAIRFTQEHLKKVSANPGSYDAVRTEDGYYEKTFIYRIKETSNDGSGVTTDKSSRTVSITVREDNKGNIKVVAVNGIYDKTGDPDRGTNFSIIDATENEPAKSTVVAGIFTNEYNASGDVKIEANKVLKGGLLRANDFYFTIEDSKGNVVGTSANDANGKISFGLTYNLDKVKQDKAQGICTSADTTDPDNGPWTYTYKVKELQVDGRGTDDVTLDTHEETVTVKVTDNGKGVLNAEVTYDSDGANFENVVKTSDLTLQKIWIDKDADEISNVKRPESVVLTVTADTNDNSILTADDGWTVIENTSIKKVVLTKSQDATSNDALWRTVLKVPAYTSDGSKIKYTVDEADTDVPANYTKSVVTAANTVINTYNITQITGKKKWVDGGLKHCDSAELKGKLTVSWTDTNGGSGTVEKPHIDWDDATHTYTVIGLPRYSDNGAERTYSVTETAPENYSVSYENTGENAATDKALDGGTIVNIIEGTVDVTGTKVWKDKAHDDAPAVSAPKLNLFRKSLKQGAQEETVEATVDWNSEKTTYTYNDLDKYDSYGYEYEYWVTEDQISGYLPPKYSDGDKAKNGGTITNIKESEGTLDIKATKIMTGSTRLSDWGFVLSLYTGQNKTGDQVGGSVTVPAGTLSNDGLSESSDVTFSGIRFRIINDGNGGVKAQMNVKNNTLAQDKWTDMTAGEDGTYSAKLYVYETPITENNKGLTQPLDGGTPVKVVVVNNNDGSLSARVASGVSAGDVIKDNYDGTVLANAETDTAKVVNKHEQTVTADINVKKILKGRNLKADDAFVFNAVYVPDKSLTEAEQARLAAGLDTTDKSISIANMSRHDKNGDTDSYAEGSIQFTFSKTGTYKFKVAESGEVAGVTNDAKDGEIVTVVISKDTDGTLKSEIRYADGSEADFTNTYDAKGDVTVKVRKLLNGISWDEDMNFWFKLEPMYAPDGYNLNNMPKPDKARRAARMTDDNDTNHRAIWNFGEFTLSDAGKQFVYKVTEETPKFKGFEEENWDLDITGLVEAGAKYHTITVVPKDKGYGTLGFDLYYDKDNIQEATPEEQSLTVTNRKHGRSRNLFASKEVVDSKGNSFWPASLSFDLQLTGLDGAPMPTGTKGDTVTVNVSDTRMVNFGAIDFDSYYDYEQEQSKKLRYTITEVVGNNTHIEYGFDGTSLYTVVVTLEFDGETKKDPHVVYYKGTAETADNIIYDSEHPEQGHYPVIKNRYSADGEVELELNKVLDGANLSADKFSFTLYDANKNVVNDKSGNAIKGKTNDANGKVTLGTLRYTEADLGRSPITYNIREDIPVGAVARDDATIEYAADTTLEVRDAHVWVKDGITYDPERTHPVTVTLKDNGEGKITVTASSATAANKLTVRNSYDAEGSYTQKVFKYLDNRPIARVGFGFEMKPVGVSTNTTSYVKDTNFTDKDVPMPEGITAGGTAETTVNPAAPDYSNTGTASFDSIRYTTADLRNSDGTYANKRSFVYEISEKKGTNPSITYEDVHYYAIVTVSNEAGNGTLTVSAPEYVIMEGTGAAPVDSQKDRDETTADFANSYDADGTAAMDAVKEIKGRSWQSGDEFTFLIEAFESDNTHSYKGGGNNTQNIGKNDVPLPGNTIDPANRGDSGNSSTGDKANMNNSGQYEAVVKDTNPESGIGGRNATIAGIKYTDDMLAYDPADGYLKGTFFYKITEDASGLADKGFTQESTPVDTYYARVDVTDDRVGTLRTVVNYYENADDAKNAANPRANAPLFTNVYDATGKAEFKVKKFVDKGSSKDDTGWSLLDDSDSFTFELTPVGGGPAVTSGDVRITKESTAHSGKFIADGIKLAQLSYISAAEGKEADGITDLKYSNGNEVPKDVNYGIFAAKLVEKDHNVTGVDKDDTEVYVKMTAIDRLDGTIDTHCTFYKDEGLTKPLVFDRAKPDDDVVFTNIYRNVMDLRVEKTWHDAGDETTVANRPDIKIQLSRKTADGNTEILNKLDGNAKLYTKYDEAGQAQIAYADGEATIKASQLPVTFKDLPATDKDGNAYIYSVTETYVGDGYFESKDPVVIAEGGDDPSTTDVIENAPRVIELTNTALTKVHVQKDWKDGDDESHRGSVVVAALYSNGTLLPNNIGLVRKNADPEWQTVFEKLPMYDDNNEAIMYTAKEMGVPEEYYTSLTEYSLDGRSWSKDIPDNWNTVVDKYVRITNILLTKFDATKVWDGIPTNNVTFELYRTTNADGKWTPDDKWEKVDGVSHTFTTEEFYFTDEEAAAYNTAHSLSGDAAVKKGDLKKDGVSYSFADLERYDRNGIEYVYRVLETTQGQYFSAHQVDNSKVTNKNNYSGLGTAKPNVVKELEGRRWNSDDRFYFRIEPVKGIGENGEPIDFTAEEADEKSKVPLPDDGDPETTHDDIKSVTASDDKVGAIGRSVDFADITFASGKGEGASVPEGGMAEYFYKVYEVDKDGNAVGGTTEKGILYTNDVHTLRIAASDDGNGKVTTQRYWDGKDSSSAVPVYVNKYKAYGEIHGYVIKRIAGREFKEGDNFIFEFTNLSGSPVRRDSADAKGTTDPKTGVIGPVGYGKEGSVYVSGNAGSYKASGADSGSDMAGAVGVNYINSGDLVAGSDGILRGTFVYQFKELERYDDHAVSKVEDLKYDDNYIYLRVNVKDNEDGTLSIDQKYFLDAACTQALAGREKIEPKLLVDTKTGEIAPAGTEEGGDYAYVATGYFRNRLAIDIPVVKKWVDENNEPTDPIDTVTVNLRRYPVYIGEDGKYYSDAAHKQKAVLPDDIDKWEPVGTHVFTMDDFYNEEGKLKEEARYVFSGLDKYEHNDAAGVPTGREYVYRVREASGSNAYETTYRVGESGKVITDWTGTDTRGDAVTVINRTVATNTANIAAVKQLLGRDWLSANGADRYKFVLTPVGRGTYDSSGNLVHPDGKVVMDKKVGTNIPLPGSRISSELSENETNKAMAADWTEYADSSEHAREIVGVGERLARFGSITYTIDDLVYDAYDKHMQGDFFYTLKEEMPAGVTQNSDGTFTYNGITYDSTIHTVHVKVRENRTEDLVVQVAYDEKTEGDITTGTQFTPVFTNRYNATAVVEANGEKYIMGRKWKEGDKFDFTMIAIGGSPFTDADSSEFPENPTKTDDQREAGLNAEKAVHTAEGAHKIRVSVPENQYGHDTSFSFTYPKLLFTEKDLNKITKQYGELKYSDGTDVPANRYYAEYMYAFEETKSFASDLERDEDTEYMKVTLIDKGNGTLDVSKKMYSDRYGLHPRYEPDTSEVQSTAAIFVNKANRTIKVSKIWKGDPVRHVTVKLQKRPAGTEDEGGWEDHEVFQFKSDETPTRPGNPSHGNINGLAVTVNVYEKEFTVPVFYDDGDDKDLNDAQLEWRIVEDTTSESSIDTYYGVDDTVLYANRESAEGYREDCDIAVDKDVSIGSRYTTDDLDKDLYVTNVYAPVTDSGKAEVNLVKELKGKSWTGKDSYTFKLDPVGIGTYDDKGSLIEQENGLADRDKLKKDESGKVITDIPVPSANATATDTNDKLSDSQRQASFGDITYTIKDLDLVDIKDSEGKVLEEVYKGDFYYDMYEVIPDDAKLLNNEGVETETTYANASAEQKKNGSFKYNGVIYDNSKHEVHVHVERSGDKIVTEVQYDGKPVGKAIPVFVNSSDSPEIISVIVQKKWDDNHDQDGKRPQSVTVTLKANGETAKDAKGRTVSDITLEKDNNWKSAFSDLPRTDSDGDVIEYSVTETAVEGYSAPVYEYGSTADSKWHDSKPVDSKGRSVWNNKVRITNSYKPGTLTVEVNKEWEGDSDLSAAEKKALRSDVTVHLYGFKKKEVVYYAGSKVIKMNSDGEQEEPAVFTDLPQRYFNDNDLEWKITEDPVYGYTSSVSNLKAKTGETGVYEATVTNTYDPTVTSVQVTKEWADDNNNDGMRPASITYELWRKVGDSKPEKIKEKTVTKDTKDVDNKPWSAKWTNLPATTQIETEDESSRTRIEYKYEQEPKMDGDMFVYIDTKDGNKEVAFTQAEIDVWDDTEKARYEQVFETVSVPEEVTESAGKVKKEVPVLYIVKEAYKGTALADAGYEEPMVVSEEPGKFRVINARKPDILDISAKKVWIDDNDADGIRPDHVVIKLTGKAANEVVVSKKATITENDDGWNNDSVHVFKNLPKYKSGTKINYSVSEIDTDGKTEITGPPGNSSFDNGRYSVSITGDGSESDPFIITNTHTSGTVVRLEATKEWVEEDGKTDLRTSVHFRLVKVDEDGARKAVKDAPVIEVANGGDNHDQNMTAVWKNLPTVENGKNIVYTVEEVDSSYDVRAPEGYSCHVGDTEEEFTAVDDTSGKNPAAEHWYVKDDDGNYKLTYHTSPQEDTTYYALSLKVTVQNIKAKIPDDGDVIYVDPLNKKTGYVGKDHMIVKSTRYTTPEEAKDHAENHTDAPPDPSHEGYQFLKWEFNYDDHDNFVLVATYAVIPKEVIPVVSYVDGQAKNPLLASVQTNDPSSVKAPKKPKHNNLQFVGWVKTIDAGGNTIFVAKYKADCANGAYTTGKGKGVKTGDSNQIVLWIATMFAAAALLSIYGEKRRRENRR